MWYSSTLKFKLYLCVKEYVFHNHIKWRIWYILIETVNILHRVAIKIKIMNIAFTSKQEQFFNVNLFSLYRNEIKLLLPVQKWILYNLCCNMFLSYTKLLLLLPTVAFILKNGFDFVCSEELILCNTEW